MDPEAGTVLLSRNLRWDSRGHVSDKRETLTRNCASWFWLPRAEKWKGSPTAWEGPRYRPGECGLCWGTFLVWVKKKILTEVITGQSSMNIIWPNKRQGRTIRTQTPGGLGSLRPPGLDTLSPRLDWQPRALDTSHCSQPHRHVRRSASPTGAGGGWGELSVFSPARLTFSHRQL